MWRTLLSGKTRSKFKGEPSRNLQSRRARLQLESLEDRSVPSVATFLRVDTDTSGDWQRVYGRDGQNVVGATPATPGYVQVTANSRSTRTWERPSTDPRALVVPDGTSRVAAAWQSYTFSVNVNVTDGQEHQLAFYVVDWKHSGLTQQIRATDPATGLVLDTRTISSFGDGDYLVYNVSGQVQFRFTAVSGAKALLSGLFFSPPEATSPPPPPPNTAPRVTDVSDQAILQDRNTGPLAFTISDAETAATGLTVQAASSDSALVPTSGLAFAGSGADRTLTVTPAAGRTGTATITLTVTDPQGLTATDTFTLTVTSPPPPPPPANTPPRVSDVADRTVPQDRNTGPLAFTVSDAETAAAGLVVGASSSDAALVPASGLAFGGSGADRTLTVTPAPGRIGSATITLTVTDPQGLTATDTFVLNVVDLAASGGVVVTPDFITTPYDRIPNFGGYPTLVSAQTGLWSNPLTWGGRLPVAGEVVSITTGVTVTFNQVSDVKYDTVAVQSGGVLRFLTDVNTRLRVTNLLVMPNATLTIGTPAAPVQAGVKAEVIINDVPLDAVRDPEQYGHGLIGLGTVTVRGAPLSDTFVRLATEPRAGDTTLTLSVPVIGWKAGDRLVLPDTRQLISNERWGNYTPQWELPIVASISADGRVLTLASPLQFDHLGARNPDGVLEFLPHVGNLARNVVLKSERATGTRGYAMFTHRANVDIRYAQFSGLGRTTQSAFDDTTFDANGAVAHAGTNQSSRYPVYFRHLMGPTTPPAEGYQFTFTGNSVSCPLNPMPFRWGVTLNDSNYGLVSDNVLYNWAGAGVVGETGRESYNVIQHNFVVATRGDQSPRNNDGRDGSAFWFNGFNNYIRDNVSTNAVGTAQGIVSGSGFNLFWPAASSANTPVPLFPGADPSVPGQYKLVNMQLTPILEFARNEVYGATATGLTLWHLGTDGYDSRPIGQSIVQDFLAWHVWEEGFFGYPINNVTFDGFTVRGDSRALHLFNAGGGWTAGDYQANNITIRRADIQGMYWGIAGSHNTQGTFTVEDSYLRNYAGNMEVGMLATPGSRSYTNARKTVIDNVRFAPYPGAPSFTTISLHYATFAGGINFTQKDEVFVYNYNGTSGDNFRVYYLEQRPDFIVPQTTYYGPDNNGDGAPDWVDNQGSPEAGLTNAQNWSKYGIAIAGAVAPTSATRVNIQGFVLPLE